MDAQSYLKCSIDSYNNALHHVHLRITTKAYDILKGIYCYILLLLATAANFYRVENPEYSREGYSITDRKFYRSL